MTPDEAVQRLLDELPEFRADYESSDGRPTEAGDQLLIHAVMEDLARFYMQHGVRDRDLAVRFWGLVEELATEGDHAVENAVWVSLIEWFAWGSKKEKAALVDAGDLQGPQTKAISAHYLSPGGPTTRGSRRRWYRPWRR